MLDAIRYVLVLAAETCSPAAVGEAPQAIDYVIVGGVVVAIAVAGVSFAAAFLRRNDHRSRAVMQMPIED